jgi:hypothetical protein
MSNKPDPNCEECHGDPNGVLGLHFYTPCTTCNHLRMSGGAKDRATYDLRQELEKEKKRVVVPDDVVHQTSTSSALEILETDGYKFRMMKSPLRLPGNWVGPEALAYRQVSRNPLPIHNYKGWTSNSAVVTFDYVEERELDDGKRIFVFFRKSWTESTTTPWGATERSSTMQSHQQIHYVSERATKEEAMEAFYARESDGIGWEQQL